MPWRVSPSERDAGHRPDPYRVWLSEVMLQQTTVAAATGHFLRFLARWPDVHALASAPREAVLAEWAGLGYYARARNLHACANVVSRDLDGRFPETEEELRALPGIGAYTAAAIAAIAFDRPATVVDGNVERVMARLFAEAAPLPGVKPQLRAHAERLTPQSRAGDYAQAVMDLGATICTPRNPACGLCPWRTPCAARASGTQLDLPARAPKPAKPVRRGVAYVAHDPRGRVLTVTRPDDGLLGGMRALPSSDWTEAGGSAPPLAIDWRPVGEVRHTFTHFHLVLKVMAAKAQALPTECGEAMTPDAALRAMPSVFAKALRLALEDLQRTGSD